ncbi:hypothetical protein J6590_083897 [Homalodisca vitripennis]|nr:hypothetical protein J6590_083897 [Homalodisca vitripennis]
MQRSYENETEVFEMRGPGLQRQGLQLRHGTAVEVGEPSVRPTSYSTRLGSIPQQAEEREAS